MCIDDAINDYNISHRLTHLKIKLSQKIFAIVIFALALLLH